MKLYKIFSTLLLVIISSYTMYGQVNTNGNVSESIATENPFIDASEYNDDFNVGKGLLFPRTDLTAWEFKTEILDGLTFSTAYDGMIIYNTGSGLTIADDLLGGIQTMVSPGFYYFYNPDGVDTVYDGEWKRLGGKQDIFIDPPFYDPEIDPPFLQDLYTFYLSDTSSFGADLDLAEYRQDITLSVSFGRLHVGISGGYGDSVDLGELNAPSLNLQTVLNGDILNFTLYSGADVADISSVDLSSIHKPSPWKKFDLTNNEPGGPEEPLNGDSMYVLSPFISIGNTGASLKQSSRGETLRVGGSILTEYSTFPDYVFENYYEGTSKINSDYEFNSLYNTEEFIKTNKHLPGVTGINDVLKTEDGYSYNISELTIQSLEKVEELFLHTIEQEKKLDQLSQENKELRERLDQIESLLNLNK